MTDDNSSKPTRSGAEHPSSSNAPGASPSSAVITPAASPAPARVSFPGLDIASKPAATNGPESTLGGRSVRSLLAFILISTLCGLDLIRAGAAIYHGEPLDPPQIRDLALIALGYFFNKQTSPPPSPTK